MGRWRGSRIQKKGKDEIEVGEKERKGEKRREKEKEKVERK